MLDHLQQPGIGAKQVLTEISAAFDKEFLILAVGDFTKALHQQAIAVVFEKRVPIRAPDALDYVPAGATENSFEFLDDFSIAAHRAVKALQIAINDKDEVVELFAGSQRNRAECFRLIDFAVT